MDTETSSKTDSTTSAPSGDSSQQTCDNSAAADQRTPPTTSSSRSSQANSVLNRPRHTKSPFFGAFRSEGKPRFSSNPSPRSATFSNSLSSTFPPTFETEKSKNPSDSLTPVSGDTCGLADSGTCKDLSAPQTTCDQLVVLSPASTNELTTPKPRKRTLLADDWWRKDKPTAPPLPLPDRPCTDKQKPSPPQQSANFRKKAEAFEQSEEELAERELLRSELSPRPLNLRKFSEPHSLSQENPADTPRLDRDHIHEALAPSETDSVEGFIDDYLDSIVKDQDRQSEQNDQVDQNKEDDQDDWESVLAEEEESGEFESTISVEESRVAEEAVPTTHTQSVEKHQPTQSLAPAQAYPTTVIYSEEQELTEEERRAHWTKAWENLCGLISTRLLHSTTMAHLDPKSAAAMTAHRREAIRLAHAQERAVVEKCRRGDQDVPAYTFEELIGKGSFGRVYRGRQTSTSKVVAIKVLDVDDADFRAFGEQKDEQIKDFNREIRILRQAQDSGAENLNPIIEALAVHSQLWLICEYCPGGSVKTLMRATNDRLSEKFIVVVARELGKALKGLHEAGIMHRDVKAANVLIHEEGRLQLCDFGVATVLDTRTDKRRTFIGTLHWMPPELWTEKPEYSDEVDVWEYGCTLYECAVGRPPNSDLRERQQLKMRMRRLKQAISLPEQDSYSEGLRSLVSYTLSPDVASRPSMKDVLTHDYLANTDESHPTTSLTELVKTYYSWLFGGGHRASLFMPGGAAPVSIEDPDVEIKQSDEWNFSMTQDFERRVSAILEIPDLSDLLTIPEMEGEETPKAPKVTTLSPPRELTATQKANFEARVKRGADLSNLFDQAKPVYEYKTKTDFVPIQEQRRISDLPFRAMAEDRPSSIASNVIDLGDFDEDVHAVAAPRTDDKIQTTYAATPMREETFRLADAATLRQKRADSKGPRESTTQATLTARRPSSADDAARRSGSTLAQDFALSPGGWSLKETEKAPELQEAAEITTSRPGHATMDWSFAQAMAESARASEPPSTTTDETPVIEEPVVVNEEKARKHATLEWSFANAMAAASAAGALETSIPVTRTTPSRPVPLLRQMTMPVTQGDFREVVDDHDDARPSTARSEALSESSQSSADVDPFALENSEGYPGPATLDEIGLSAYYSRRGRTLPGESPDTTFNHHNNLTTSIDLNDPSSTLAVPYALGRPARIGEPGFPGPATISNMPAGARLTGHQRGFSANGSTGSSSTGITGHAQRPVVEVPDVKPPSMDVMMSNASNEDIEKELTRLLEGMQGTLHAASQVVQSRRRRGRSGRPSSSEWEDED